jgi:hypothetical protein
MRGTYQASNAPVALYRTGQLPWQPKAESTADQFTCAVTLLLNMYTPIPQLKVHSLILATKKVSARLLACHPSTNT